MSKKMEEVRDAGVRVVSEDFLKDIKVSGKALQELVSLHAISPWGAEVKVEAPAPSVASKSGAVATKSTGRVKEEEGKGYLWLLLVVMKTLLSVHVLIVVSLNVRSCFRRLLHVDLCYNCSALCVYVCIFINNYIYTITGSSKAKKMKLTVKGGAAVDPDSGTPEYPRLNELSLCPFFFS